MKFCGMIIALAILHSVTVYAGGEWDPRPLASELPGLPKYCKEKTGYGVDGGVSYKTVFGQCWEDMHHLCFGLNYLNRATTQLKDPEKRSWDIQEAISNIEYVNKSRYVGSCDKIRHELNFFLGRAYELKKDDASAMTHYLKAITLQPKYVNPYISLSRLYKKHNDIKSAREVLENGIKASPNAKGLIKALSDLK